MGQYTTIVKRIYENALVLIEQKGLFVENEKLLKKLEGLSGISVKDHRVFFTPAYAEAFLERYYAQKEYTEAKVFTTSTLGHANHIVDWNDTLRPITEADCCEMARLTDALADQGIFGSAPGIPQDVPLPLQGISQFISSAKNSRSSPVWAGYKSLKNELLIKDCLEILGRSYGIGVHLISPLKLAGNEVDISLELAERFPEMPVSIGGMPIVGLSTPATIVSGFTIGVAEILACGMMFDAVGMKKIDMSVNLYPFDMKYMSFVYGTPANVVINRIEIEINKQIFKTQIVSKCLRTMSQMPNQQAAVQKATYAGIMAEYGKRNFTGAGSLSMDEIFSPVQLMVDNEIMSTLKKIYEMNDTVFDEEHLLLDVILENEDDDYIVEPTTLEFFRENQWDSKLFPSYQVQQWIEAGRPDVLQNAKEMAKKLIAENGFELEKEKAAALDKIYDWAKQHMNEL